MHRPQEQRPATVPARAMQAGAAQARWGWVEPSVWTERMLTALERGVKGDKWFSLIDKVYDLRNLQAAFARVATNRGSPGSTTRRSRRLATAWTRTWHACETACAKKPIDRRLSAA